MRTQEQIEAIAKAKRLAAEETRCRLVLDGETLTFEKDVTTGVVSLVSYDYDMVAHDAWAEEAFAAERAIARDAQMRREAVL